MLFEKNIENFMIKAFVAYTSVRSKSYGVQ